MLASVCAAMATFLIVPKSTRGRCHRLFGAPRPKSPVSFSPAIVGAALVAFGVLLVLPLPLSVIVAVVATPLSWRFIGRLESGADRRRRLAVNRQLPGAIDLLVAVLESGRPPSAAFSLVGRACEDPIGSEFTAIAGRLSVSGDEATVWSTMQTDPEFSALGRSFARATRSGTSIAAILSRLADELRRNRRSAAAERARSVGVSTAAPLGLCFLPAFFLIGIAPAIIGAFQELVF